MHRLRDVDLSGHNSFGVAARAREVLVLDARSDAPALLEAIAGDPIAPLLIGGGSNLLFAADPVGPVVFVRSRGRRILEDDGERVVLEIEAGENWHETVCWTLAQRLYGLENLALIPGSVGAAPWQNIGAYGVELETHVEAVEALDLGTGERRRFSRAECGFGYRDSVFKRAPRGRWLILSVALVLSRRPSARVEYGELRAELGSTGAAADPLAIAEAVTRIRRRKLPDPAVLGNAGSFFKNPVLDADDAAQLVADNPGLPLYPIADATGRRKASAAWLIDACGWKGVREGAVGVSAAHALVLVNYGGGTGREVLALAVRIQQSVRERFGVQLEPEPTIVV